MEWSRQERRDLTIARNLLESGGFAGTMGNWFAGVMDKISDRFPQKWREMILFSAVLAIEKSWEFTVGMMSGSHEPSESELTHKIRATISGAAGGVAIPTLLAEIPVTTVIMLRSVADIAREEGEDFRDINSGIACLEVFALGGEKTGEDAAETGYYRTRDFLQRPVAESSAYIAQKGAIGVGAPFLAQLAAKIAARYQTAISARLAAAVVPAAGAICGAAVNIVFIDYFQKKARGHFIMRRLERKRGLEPVRQAYQEIGPPDTEAP
ncbi:conserved hypothetical protein [Candidatus Desulfarcum epimagneticum]|uniref:Peptidase n=1 Tax=uncultured Desulfobacteraceae bacterium TaxID=218296 RepID=A0A484HQ15_9BACT|nr:conserved hypothetical protein [uncultured Desulfobacteraceae bacterium]